MDFVWDYYLCLDAKIQSSQVFGYSIQREIANISSRPLSYEGWNFNSGNYLFTTDTK